MKHLILQNGNLVFQNGFLKASGGPGSLAGSVSFTDNKATISNIKLTQNAQTFFTHKHFFENLIDLNFYSNCIINGPVFKILRRPDNLIVLLGAFTQYLRLDAGNVRDASTSTYHHIVSIQENGTRNTSFTNNPSPSNAPFIAGGLQSNNRVIIGGNFTSVMGNSASRIARINTDGTFDSGFNIGSGFNGLVRTILIQPDDKILVGGDFTDFNGNARNRIVRLNSNGTLDTTFNIGTGFDGSVHTISLQADNKILVGGAFNVYNSTSRLAIARLNPDGSLDTSFVPGTSLSDLEGVPIVKTIAIDGSGKIWVGGKFSQTGFSHIKVLLSNGSVDGTYSLGGPTRPGPADATGIEKILIKSNGDKIIIGNFYAWENSVVGGIVKIVGSAVSAGSLSRIFLQKNISLRDVVELSDGSLLLAGDFNIVNGFFIQPRFIAKIKDVAESAAGVILPSAKTYNDGTFKIYNSYLDLSNKLSDFVILDD